MLGDTPMPADDREEELEWLTARHVSLHSRLVRARSEVDVKIRVIVRYSRYLKKWQDRVAALEREAEKPANRVLLERARREEKKRAVKKPRPKRLIGGEV